MTGHHQVGGVQWLLYQHPPCHCLWKLNMVYYWSFLRFLPRFMNLLFLPVQVAVIAVFDFQHHVVVLTTEVVDRVDTKKKRPFLSFIEASDDATVAKMPRIILPNNTIIFLYALNIYKSSECFNLAVEHRLRSVCKLSN